MIRPCNIHHKKNKSLKGNISILFIFILLATSTIVLLAMNQIRHLMEYGDTADDYFKMYYLGKAGVELAMTEVQSRGYGFNHYIDSGDAILQNFDTGADENQQHPSNYFTYTITGRFNDFYETLETGDVFMIPLFYDQGHDNQNITISHSGVLASGDYYLNLGGTYKQIEVKGDKELLFSLIKFDSGFHEMLDIWQYIGKELDWDTTGRPEIMENIETETENNRRYLTIKNYQKGNNISITGNDSTSNRTKIGIPLMKSEIQVNAHYQDEEMGMEITYNRPVPAFMTYSVGLSKS